MTEPSARPGRLGVGIVGVGRVGAALGSALRAVGHPVIACSAISQESRDRAEVMLLEAVGVRLAAASA